MVTLGVAMVRLTIVSRGKKALLPLGTVVVIVLVTGQLWAQLTPPAPVHPLPASTDTWDFSFTVDGYLFRMTLTT